MRNRKTEQLFLIELQIGKFSSGKVGHFVAALFTWLS